ncbi:MAG TPA: MBL fold metallo-hydrolase [Solirubrobacterales bacterium]|nr:MBL fold metallo-hydrolase [Solirubrobacterales bacterium]
MRIRWLGWAGVEIEADQGPAVVIDPLADPGAVFAALGDGAGDAELPTVVAPEARDVVAGLVTHLHRDHADAGALAAALSDRGAVFEPAWPGGEDLENLALAQAAWELDRAGLSRRVVEEWERLEVGPFALTALPAVDGLGDPQVSWLVEADGFRVLHLGDTVFHGYWWRMARRHGPFDVLFAPINGAVVAFPHLQPPSPLAATLEAEQAAVAGELLGAGTVVPIHYGGFAVDPWYRPGAEPLARFEAAVSARPCEGRALEPGESFEPSRPFRQPDLARPAE